MFVVTLRFSDNRAEAKRLMDGHNEWLRQGFDDGIFLLSGSLAGGTGGAILAHNLSRTELETRLGGDPFVVENVVSADIVEIAPGRTDARLGFLAA